MSKRLGVLVTHPVQYYSPWFKQLGEKYDLTVYYAHRPTAADQVRAGFGIEFEWDLPLLDGYQYEWLKNVSKGRAGWPFFRYDTPELDTIVADGSFDGFLIFGWNYKSAWQAYRACKRHSVPVLMRGDSQLLPPRGPIVSVAKRLLYPRFLSGFSAHLYVGRRNKDYLRFYGVPEERLFFAPHFVDVDRFRTAALEAEAAGDCDRLREARNIPKDAFVFLFVGKLIEKKRPKDFLRAIMRFRNLHSKKDVHALVVGDGPLRQELVHLARPSSQFIHFVGFINQTRLPTYYRASDALVLPSTAEETWGLVVNEAAACGIPSIVSSEVGCVPDLIDNRKTGFSFDIGNIDAIARYMDTVHALRGANPSEVANALRSICRRYSIARATQGLDDALLAAHRARISLLN